ncbi:hypothetical protein [Methanolacinia paynteri]|nr:hypothetical protein [Methanolacinia paynteri]
MSKDDVKKNSDEKGKSKRKNDWGKGDRNLRDRVDNTIKEESE